MKFKYSAAPQLSEEWIGLGMGVVTASNLYRWEAVSKKDGVTPLKARADYEKELMFERQFNQTFSKFVSGAMRDGTEFEAFARKEYERVTGNTVEEVGCWYNEFFRASPDGNVKEPNIKDPQGHLEIKWLKDTNWTEVLLTKKPYVSNGQADHWKQCQGQMFASGLKWTDYAACNETTGKMIIIRVFPDKEYFKSLEASLKQPIVMEKFDLDGVHEIGDPIAEKDLTVDPIEKPTITKDELKDF